MRRRYRRSLYGHANQYGVFTDLALRWTVPGGVIAYVDANELSGCVREMAVKTIFVMLYTGAVTDRDRGTRPDQVNPYDGRPGRPHHRRRRGSLGRRIK